MDEALNEAPKGARDNAYGGNRIAVKAIELRDQAELAWDEGHYTEADKLISEAHHILAEIPLPAEPVSWWIWLIGGSASAVAGGLLVYFLWWRRRGEG